jgi:hypothetical protein
MVAVGMVDLDELPHAQRLQIIGQARKEAHAVHHWISGCTSTNCCEPLLYPAGSWSPMRLKNHRLSRWKGGFSHKSPRRPSLTERTHPLATGTFKECCAALVAIITPSDHNPAE